MYKMGDEIMIRGCELWGEGRITDIKEYSTGNCYDAYFRDVGMYVANIKQKELYRIVTILPRTYSLRDVLEEFSSRLNKISSNEFNWRDFNMLNITNYKYKYTEDTAITTIEWSDGTKTTVHAEHPEKADPYTGFVTACAKKAFGNNNTINNLFDEWAVKKPEREIKAKIKANAAELEARRIAEKRKAKREKWLVRRRAADINREYEA